MLLKKEEGEDSFSESIRFRRLKFEFHSVLSGEEDGMVNAKTDEKMRMIFAAFLPLPTQQLIR